MTILINDEPVEVADDAALADLLRIRNPRPPFAVEVNKRLVRRAEYAAVRLSAGDKVEVVTLVGGG